MLFRCKCDMMNTLQKLPFPGMNAGKRSEIKGRNPMNLLILTSIILSVILGVGRMVDLALFTDAETGLCVVGSVWLRYAALAVAILLAVAAGRAAKPEARKLCSPCKPSGVMAVLGAGFMAATFVAKLALWDSSVVGRIIMAFLSLFCSAWLLALGRSWMSKSWKRPSDDLTHVVLGTAVFYWCVLARFMENSSSWHRVEPTAMVWQMLAALVFLSAMVRALWLPETSNGCQLCEAGICTFLLCFCWELPRVLVLLFHGITAADLPEVLFGFGMCCIGALGLFTVARVAGSDGRPAIPRHAVG